MIDDQGVVIPLSRGMHAIVDEVDATRMLALAPWNAAKQSTRFHTIYYATFAKRKGHEGTRLMHRLILDAPVDMVVDHINGNGLDNRRANLRLASVSQNRVNISSPARLSKSGFIGVSRSGDKWRVQISCNGVMHSLGVFVDPVEAAHVYDRAAMKLHGEFATLNFPNASTPRPR